MDLMEALYLRVYVTLFLLFTCVQMYIQCMYRAHTGLKQRTFLLFCSVMQVCSTSCIQPPNEASVHWVDKRWNRITRFSTA